MRPTTSTMLQQNNNNNYPCLNVSGSTREMLQECSRGSLPFPSRLELGLGDLPLVRGLRAWALCSKNRRKAGGLLGGGQAPTAPPASRGNSTSCPRPADVYPTGEWGRMGYGLPLGLDARQAGIGALVTVATLKTSEGGGKTQTQCLFLRTEKGSCLYSTAKPGARSLGSGPGMTPAGASTLVGGWLRGKVGGGGGSGGGGTPAGRRDNGPPAQTGANRVRLRSGRRWRKSGNAAGPGQERAGLNREKRSREEEAREIILEERQEETDKGGSKQPPSPQQDSRRGRQEKVGANRSCCHNASAKTCTRCGRGAGREEQDGHEGGEGPRGGVLSRLSDDAEEKQEKEADEEEQRGGLIGLESYNAILVTPDPDLETNHLYPGCEVGEGSREPQEALQTQTSRSKDVYSEREEDSDPQTGDRDMKTRNCDIASSGSEQADDFTLRLHGDLDDGNRELAISPCVAAKLVQKTSEETVADVNGFSGHAAVDGEAEQESESLTGQKGDRSNCMSEEGCLPSPTAAPYSPSKTPETSTPVEGSTSIAEHKGKQENSTTDSKHNSNKEQHGGGDSGIVDQEELDGSRFVPNCVAEYKTELCRNNGVQDTLNELHAEDTQSASEEDRGPCKQPREALFLDRQLEEGNTSSTLDGHRGASIFETDIGISSTDEIPELNEATEDGRRDESAADFRGEDLENLVERVKPEEGDEAEEIWRKECTSEEIQDGGIKGDGQKRHQAEDELEGWADERGRQEVKRNVTTEEGVQESEEEWGAEREGIPHRSVPLVVERGIGGGWEDVEDGGTCRPLSPSLTAATAAANAACADPSTSRTLSPANPAPPPLPPGAMATGRPRLEVEGVGAPGSERERRGERVRGSAEEAHGEEERGCTVAAEQERKEEEEEEDEFGVFMQAEGEPAWSDGFAMSASVPCGSRESVALGSHAVAGESTHWTSGWTDSSFHQSEDTWTAFPQDSVDEGRDSVGQWWPISAVEERRDRLSANQNLTAVFAKAFPSLAGPSSCDLCDPCDPNTVPTLTQLLRGNQHHSRTSQDQGLLDNFHDLNKMIGQRYKRANGVSRDRLLKTLHLDPTYTESRPGPWTASRRLSPGLPSANQHAQNAAAKRRLSYDYNRNIME